jgi:hypothetical protein
MTLYPCMMSGKHYNELQLWSAVRKEDYPKEPSWGIYQLDTGLAVLVDCDVEHARQQRTEK